MKKIITSDKAPGAIGPYSQAVEVNGVIYTSGQLGMNWVDGELTEGIEAQTRTALRNVEAILLSAGSSLEKVFKTLVFISDMNNFSQMNEVYKEFFKENFPARSCVEVSRLPKDAMVEIEVIALR
ncbi:MAG: reactive intermediate/imine deaminase [Spirochaeta sp. LUC14_002_19_P3]|nr:MAG: reactive intermediate/imine deaminase [Spirochaeta sp. LUC14_002_19_P3]